MEVKAGLGGQLFSGQTSEIKIHLFATIPLEGEIELIDGNGLTKLHVQLDEQKEKNLWLPVNPTSQQPVRIRLITDQGVLIEKKLAFELSVTPLTIITNTVPVDETLDTHNPSIRITPVILSATGLPHITQAYAGVETLIIDTQTLSRLSQDQYHALAYHLSRCNIMLLSSTDQTVLERLRSISGCGGRFVQSYHDLSQVIPMLQKLNAVRLPKIPAPQDLMPLRQTSFQQQMLTSISLYLGGYILLLTLAVWRMRKTHTLLLLPGIVAAAGALVWTGEGNRQLISWAETESGATHNNISSLLLFGGDRLGENRVTLGPETRLSNFIGGSQEPVIHYQQDSDHRVLSGHTPLLLPQAYHLTTTTRQPSQYQLTINEGKPEAVYLGEESPAETRLLWRGNTYKLPVMLRGDRWQPDTTQAGAAPASPAERLLNRRLAFDDAALLLPYVHNLAELDDRDTQTSGWLVIRHKPEQYKWNKTGQML